jgi:lipoprotein-anchoring transpeptidase ErfK/SrfK
MGYGEFVWNDAGIPAGIIWIRVDLSTQLMSIFRGGHEIGTAVIMYGADKKPTPVGDFPILWKAKDHRSSLYEAAMPYTMRLTQDGVAIHGANVRARAASHGCISVPTDFAKLLFARVKVGDLVSVLPEKSAQKRA